MFHTSRSTMSMTQGSRKLNSAYARVSASASASKAHHYKKERSYAADDDTEKKVTRYNYTENQCAFVRAVRDNSVVVLSGPAGSGKTMCAVDAGVRILKSRDKESEIKRLIITRPAVCVSEEHGFLPGSLEEKMKPWMMPIYDSLLNHFSQQEIDNLINARIIEISPIAYMRGRTFQNAFVICDEMQNCTASQVKMVLTRIGTNSKMVLTGDPDQDDLRANDGSNGLKDLLSRLDRNGVPEGVEYVKFTRDDIMRHPVISNVLSLYNN